MASCICAEGPGDRCHLCNPQAWKQISDGVWVPRRELGESNMHEHHSKKQIEKFEDQFELDEVDENRNEPVTRLLQKNLSPMIIRKYQGYGWPLFVAIICDLDLSDLDEVVTGFVQECNSASLGDIQMFRDWCGSLSQIIVDHYNEKKFGSVEGVAVIAYWDKCLCSSLYGDHMTHGQCRLELFTLLNMMTQT